MTQPLPSPRDFLLKTPLYAVFAYSGDKVWDVLDILYFEGTYDSYCTKCARDSTFQVAPRTRSPEHVRNTSRENLFRAQGQKYPHPQLAHDIYLVRAKCTRNNAHTQDFVFLADTLVASDDAGKYVATSTIQKVGQQPSFGDVHIAKVKKYAPALSKPQLRELNRAIGLASHDVGVGSYVYLRRVFEALVEEAHAASRSDAGWDDESYLRSRMSEKIAMLRQHLPKFLGEHPEMYSLLSKGVHELSEEDCLAHFDTLRIGIELILDDKLERQERERKIKEAKAALARAVGAAKA